MTQTAVTADPILGFYGPGSQMWRINREAVLLGAGPAALLLQIAHPHVAEGVMQHSDFLADPVKRLRGTLRTTMDLVFGDGPHADRAVRHLNHIHAAVQGEVDDPMARDVAGPAYRALDPDLLLWVQATLIVTSVRAYAAWVGPLTAADRDAFWAEARDVGQRIGIPLSRSPSDWAGLEAYFERMLAPDGPLQVTPTARRLAPSIIRPPLPFLPGPLADLATIPALTLLPPRLREAFGIPWGPGREALATLLVPALRVWVRVMPAGWRAMPQARAAERRASAAGHGRQAAYNPRDHRRRSPTRA